MTSVAFFSISDAATIYFDGLSYACCCSVTRQLLLVRINQSAHILIIRGKLLDDCLDGRVVPEVPKLILRDGLKDGDDVGGVRDAPARGEQVDNEESKHFKIQLLASQFDSDFSHQRGKALLNLSSTSERHNNRRLQCRT